MSEGTLTAKDIKLANEIDKDVTRLLHKMAKKGLTFDLAVASVISSATIQCVRHCKDFDIVIDETFSHNHHMVQNKKRETLIC